MIVAVAISLLSYKLKQPMVIGYIIAGMIIGPLTFNKDVSSFDFSHFDKLQINFWFQIVASHYFLASYLQKLSLAHALH
jgi:Kef-type K+ transport system membrane component KefB